MFSRLIIIFLAQKIHMNSKNKKQTLLQNLPGVDRILEIAQAQPFFENIPKTVVVHSIRSVIEDLRTGILDGSLDITENSLSDTQVLENVKRRAREAMTPKLLLTNQDTWDEATLWRTYTMLTDLEAVCAV